MHARPRVVPPASLRSCVIDRRTAALTGFVPSRVLARPVKLSPNILRPHILPRTAPTLAPRTMAETKEKAIIKAADMPDVRRASSIARDVSSPRKSKITARAFSLTAHRTALAPLAHVRGRAD